MLSIWKHLTHISSDKFIIEIRFSIDLPDFSCKIMYN